MARSTPDKIILPSDAGNTGAKTPTMTRTIGSDIVHVPLFIKETREVVKGVYRASMALQSVQAAAQNGTSTAFLWISCPAAVTDRAMRLRKMELQINHSASTTMPTVPRIGIARYTFTGTASGATLAGAKIDPDAPNPSIDLRTASTGMTITLNTNPGSLLNSVLVPPMHNVTAAGLLFAPSIPQYLVDISADEDEWPMIKAGQGIVLYQLDAGTATDTRRFTASMTWDEIEI
jgi:hypothetical protein